MAGDHRRPEALLEELPGRVQLLAVAAFFAVWAAIAFVPRL